jgi:predicted TIM-barrel fold metal-dependent hydrolase
VIPKLLRTVSNGEYAPAPLSPAASEALRRVLDQSDTAARRLRMDRRSFLRTSAGAAMTMLALSACSSSEKRSSGEGAPAGTFDLPPTSATDPDAASTTLAPIDGEVVVDVQTHFLDPDTTGFGRGFPQSSCGEDPDLCFTTDTWLDLVFGSSDTSVAVLSALPIVADPHPMSIEKMEAARRLADELCGERRVLLQGEAFPQVGALGEALDRMSELAEAHDLVAWKTYTHVGGGYSFSDARGEAFLAHIAQLAASGAGPNVLCVHKGFGADPADVGPAARAHPELTFCVYHSGYESGVNEGPFSERGNGVDRLIRSLRDAGIGPGSNVFAELGSTWFSVLRDPDQAAHVLGKLLVAVGPERVLWGTDSVWYGSPQDQIDAFRAFAISAEAQERFGYPALTDDVKRSVLGHNAARLHGIDLAAVAAPCRLGTEERETARGEALGRLGPVADATLGPTTGAAAAAVFRAEHPWF